MGPNRRRHVDRTDAALSRQARLRRHVLIHGRGERGDPRDRGRHACDAAANSSDPKVCQHAATAELLAGADAVLPLGDLQYPDGTLEQFQGAYDPTWGVHASVSYPAVGNHEYHVPGAAGYFDYWSGRIGQPVQ